MAGRVTHLGCGTGCPVGGRLVNRSPARIVCHCLLVETDDGYVLIGHCYKENGNDEQALKAYNKALSINRSNTIARREVARLDKGKPGEDISSTGIFGKLFGR